MIAEAVLGKVCRANSKPEKFLARGFFQKSHDSCETSSHFDSNIHNFIFNFSRLANSAFKFSRKNVSERIDAGEFRGRIAEFERENSSNFVFETGNRGENIDETFRPA